jgi:hypothetical protein
LGNKSITPLFFRIQIDTLTGLLAIGECAQSA